MRTHPVGANCMCAVESASPAEHPFRLLECCIRLARTAPFSFTCSWLLLCLSDSLLRSSLKLPTACAARLVQGAQKMLLCSCLIHEVPEVLQHSSILFTAAVIMHADSGDDLQYSMPASLSLLPER